MKRKTSQRSAIRKVFLENERPLGVDEILEKGRAWVETLNLATVYRNLRLLVISGWLIQIHHPSLGMLYERSGKGHHHHFHCRICDRLFELPGCVLNAEKAAPDGFVTEDHEVFLYGVCSSCAPSVSG